MVNAAVSSASNHRVDEIVEIEGRALIDAHARKYLHMRGDEFIARYAAGNIPDPDRSEVVRVAILLPFIK